MYVAVELNYGTLYCFKCRDYIYDATLDEISRSIDQQLAHKNYHISRQPVAYVAWEPTNDEIDLLKKNPKRKRVEPGSTIGEFDIRDSTKPMKILYIAIYHSIDP